MNDQEQQRQALYNARAARDLQTESSMIQILVVIGVVVAFLVIAWFVVPDSMWEAIGNMDR